MNFTQRPLGQTWTPRGLGAVPTAERSLVRAQWWAEGLNTTIGELLDIYHGRVPPGLNAEAVSAVVQPIRVEVGQVRDVTHMSLVCGESPRVVREVLLGSIDEAYLCPTCVDTPLVDPVRDLTRLVRLLNSIDYRIQTITWRGLTMEEELELDDDLRSLMRLTTGPCAWAVDGDIVLQRQTSWATAMTRRCG